LELSQRIKSDRSPHERSDMRVNAFSGEIRTPDIGALILVMFATHSIAQGCCKRPGMVRLGYNKRMSKPPKEPKHHYIPIFYLQQWTDEDGRLIEFCRRYQGLVARPTFPDGTGYVRGLYKLPGMKPGHEYIIETKVMGSIDTWAARALQDMMVDGDDAGRLDGRKLFGWCQFLYSLIVRNPQHLELIAQKLRTLDADTLLEEIKPDYPRIRRPEDPENFEEFKAKFTLNPADIPATRVLPSLLGSRRVVGTLASLNWHTTSFPSRRTLLTSDRPIIMSNGLTHKEAHIVLPIAPRRLFIATNNAETFEAIKSQPPDTLVEAVNNQVAQQAYKFVYGADDKQLRFVANRLGKRVRSSPLD
jgi:Protein of unknown function (DUF4238)